MRENYIEQPLPESIANASDGIRGLMKKLLKFNPIERITVKQACDDPVFSVFYNVNFKELDISKL